MRIPTCVLGALCVPIAGAAPRVTELPTPHQGIQPVAEADPEGTLHLVYFRGDPGHGDLYYTRRPRGAVDFAPPVRVNAREDSAVATGTIRGARLALGRNGHIHLAWMGSSAVSPEGDPRRAPMLYTRSTDGGMSFEPERNLITDAYGLDGGGAVAADSSGNVAVFWHAGPAGKGETERRVWISRSSDDGESFAPEVPAWDQQTGACGCCGMNAAAGAGRIWALYRAADQRVHRDIYLLKSDASGARFAGERLDTWETASCPMSAMGLAFAGDTVALAWEAEGGGIAFALPGTGVRGGIPHAKAPRKYPTVALSPDGTLLVAWIDGAGWQKGGRLGWQLFDPKGIPLGSPATRNQTAVWTKPAAIFDGAQFVIVH